MRSKASNLLMVTTVFVSVLSVNPRLAAADASKEAVAVETAGQRDARMAWWREARFGMIPATGMPGVDWETCMTLNTTWGYSEHDHAWKSDTNLIRNLVDIASKGGNYLLNIGPKGDGSLTPQTIRSFEAIGKWMKVNREAIYGTSASPFSKLDWGRATQKGDVLYLHVFNWPKDGSLVVPLKSGVKEARLLASRKKLKFTNDASGLTLKLPEQAPDAIASVIKLKIAGEPEVVTENKQS